MLIRAIGHSHKRVVVTYARYTHIVIRGYIKEALVVIVAIKMQSTADRYSSMGDSKTHYESVSPSRDESLWLICDKNRFLIDVFESD